MDKDAGLEPVIQRIKEAYLKQTSALEVPIHTLEEKIKEYRQAAKADLLAEFLERNGLPTGERRTETAALALYEALHGLPEFRPVVVDVPDVPEEDPETFSELAAEVLTSAPVSAEWPVLKQISPKRPVVIFGGYVLEDKLAWLQSSGVTAEWIANSNGVRGSSAVQKLSARIRSGAYCGVIVLNELIGHDESAMILAACRASGTFYAMGRKAGKGQLRIICDEFEKRLKEESK
jgi:hypothetical protein